VGAITLEKSANANAPLAVPPTEPPLAKAALPEIRAAISRYLLESEADRSKGKARK
jgi:hypothetical protein